MAVPKLRFEGFSEEWKQKRLIELCDIFGRIGFRGYTVDDIVSKDEGVLTLSPGNINTANTLFLKENNTYITHFKYEESPEIKIQNRDILFVKTGSTLGKFCYVENLNEPATINPQLIVLKNSKINPKFISILLGSKNIQNKIAQTRIGGAVPTLTQNEFGNYASFVPSTDEANKISVFFELIDKKIQLQQEKIDLLKEQKKGFMQKIFKIPSNSTTNIYYLSQLGNFYKGHTLAKQDLSDDGLPCVLYGHLYTEYNEVISSVKYKTANTSGFPGIKGDLLIPSSGETVIDIARTAALQEDALLGGDLTILRVDSQIVDSVYLSYLINAKYKFTLAKFAQGASVVHLYSSEIKKLAVELPTIEQQYKVGSVLLKIDKKILLEESKKHALLIQKQAFLQQMFI